MEKVFFYSILTTLILNISQSSVDRDFKNFMSRKTQLIIYCLLILSNTSFGQSGDSMKTNSWVNTILKNAITEPKASETFHHATMECRAIQKRPS